MIRIELPFPPGVNNLFFNVSGRGRRLTAPYKAWRESAGWDVQIAKPGKISGKVRIDMKFEDGRRNDLDGLPKAILDLLVMHGVIQGDGPSCVRDLRLRFDDRVSGALVEIFPIPAVNLEQG